MEFVYGGYMILRQFKFILVNGVLFFMICSVGCGMYGEVPSVEPTAPVDTKKMSMIQIPVNLATDTAVNKAPVRAASVTSLAEALDFEFLNATTLAPIRLTTSPVVKNISGIGDVVEVAGEFIGVKVLVRIQSRTLPDKVENLYLGKIPDSTMANSTIVSKVEISVATIIATRNLIQKSAGEDTNTRIKALANGSNFSLLDDLTTTTTNLVIKESQFITDAVASGAIKDFDGTDLDGVTTTDKLLDLIGNIKTNTTTLGSVEIAVTARETVYPLVTGISPTTIAKKDVATAVGQITIIGTNFGTDSSRIVVTVLNGDTTVATKTGLDFTLTTTSIKFNILADEIKTTVADYTGKILTVTVKKIIVPGIDEPVLTLSSTLTVTPAAMFSLAITPTSANLVKGTTQQFTATAAYDDSTLVDVTDTVVWTVTSGTISPITRGLYTAPAGETAVTVTAFLAGLTSIARVSVSSSPLTAITVTGAGGVNSVKQGFTLQLVAMGITENDSTFDVTSSTAWSIISGSGTITDSGLLTVSGAGPIIVNGKVIDALNGEVNGQKTIVVDALQSVQITAMKDSVVFSSGGTMKASETLSLAVTGTYSTGSVSLPAATFTVTNGSVIQSVFTPIVPGAALIKTTFAGIQSTPFNVTVSDDPGIRNVRFKRLTAMTAIISWETAYPIALGQILHSKRGSFSDGVDPFSQTITSEGSVVGKNHAVTVTVDTTENLSTGGLGNPGWRCIVGYQLSGYYQSDVVLLEE